MKYYKTTTEYNCGIDLHAKQMYVFLSIPPSSMNPPPISGLRQPTMACDSHCRC
jgi:hypothetical protein